jgi:hypothetical protein
MVVQAIRDIPSRKWHLNIVGVVVKQALFERMSYVASAGIVISMMANDQALHSCESQTQ